MKLQAIKRVCLARNRWRIVNASDGSQWLSDWTNYYRIVGISISEEYIQDVFALTDKQMKKAVTETSHRRETFFREDMQAFGDTVSFAGGVWAFEQLIYAFDAGGKTLYVPEIAIKPTQFENCSDLRLVYDAGHNPLIGIYHGFFCDAWVSPIETEWAARISEALAELGGKPVFGAGREVSDIGEAAVN